METLLMAIFSNGKKKYFIKENSIKRQDILLFIDSLGLNNNDHIMILDNASIHKNISSLKFSNFLYTPPYCPQFNAIELTFGIIKN